MELKVRKFSSTYIIDVNGEMDLYNSYKLKELVLKMIEKQIDKRFKKAAKLAKSEGHAADGCAGYSLFSSAQ